MSADTKKLSIFLRVYGVLQLCIFVPLMAGLLLESPLLAEHGGSLNWTIWNDVRASGELNYVPPMLFTIYLVWAVFFFLAAKQPREYLSFLSFTMWANLFHGLLMVGQATTDIDQYWPKFFTDIPFILGISLGIYLLRPENYQTTSAATPGRPGSS